MVAIYQYSSSEAFPDNSYDVDFVVTAEKAKQLKQMQHIKNIRTKKQLSDVAGENSFAMGMYKKYLEHDKNYECKVSFDVLPSAPEASDAKIDITFTGTSEEAYEVSLKILDFKDFSLTKEFAGGTLITDVAKYFIEEMAKWKNFPFTIKPYELSAEKIELTSKVSGEVANKTPIKVEIKGTGITSSIKVTPATGSASADDLISYINSNKIKHKMYVFEDGIDTTNFEKALESWQNYNNLDKRGCMLTTAVDTMENLVTLAESKNKTFLRIVGLQKSTDEKYNQLGMQPCFVSALLAGIFNFFYTKNTLASLYNSKILLGSIDNVSIPLCDMVIGDYKMEEGLEWLENEDGNEIKILNDAGISTLTTNKNGVVTIGNMVTTYTKDIEGNLDRNFHWMEFDESVSAFLTYMFERLKRIFKHERMQEGLTKSDFIIECSQGYKICAGLLNDEITNETFHFVRPAGLDVFLEDLRNNTIEDFNDGKLVSAKVTAVVYAQLREIIMNYKFKN